MGFALGIAGYVLHTNGTFDKLFAPKEYASAEEAFAGVTEQPTQTTEVVEITAEPTVEPTVEPTAAPVAEAVTEPTTPTEGGNILPMHKGSSYAVWGVYNELSNAEKAKEWVAERFPDIDVEVYQYDARYMVALCEVQSRTECGRKVSAWKAQHKSFANVWVYTR